MSRKVPFRPQASSSRAVSGAAFGGVDTTSALGRTWSPLAYATEPPNFYAISDPNAVVILKNVMKKDSKTKEKALEDLQTYISGGNSDGGKLEEALVETWVRIYPRTSIDSSRRVRQLAHTFQGDVSLAYGKRIAKYMPDIVGAWLAGTNDPDKVVAGSAQSSLRRVFPTAEKLRGLGRVYQQAILNYTKNAIFQETVQSLSDERTVSPDDAQAKYARVVASGISVISNLLIDLDMEDLMREESTYSAILGAPQVWDFASYPDPSVRRSTFRLLRACMLKQQGGISQVLDAISIAFISKALTSNQTGSAHDLVETLNALTAFQPTVWTEHYKAKKPAITRLQQFLKKGSQGGPSAFWAKMSDLSAALPVTLISRTAEDSTDLLHALHAGILNRDEPRSNLAAAWTAYLKTAEIVADQLQADDQQRLLFEAVYPIVKQYVNPLPENSQWSVLDPYSLTISAQAVQIGMMPKILEAEWPRLGNGLAESIKISAPEQSKDFDKSQKAVADTGSRWFSLQVEILKRSVRPLLRPTFSEASCGVVKTAIEVLVARNGKPYGAAGVIEVGLHLCSNLLFENSQCAHSVTSLVMDTLPELLQSPSGSQLILVLYDFAPQQNFPRAWRAALDAILQEPETASKLRLLREFLFSPRRPLQFSLAVEESKLQNYLVKVMRDAIRGNTDWSFCGQVLRHASSTMSQEALDTILVDMANALSSPDTALKALEATGLVARQSGHLLQEFLSKPSGSSLLPNVLFLTEAEDEGVAGKAREVNVAIESLLSTGLNGVMSALPKLEIIQDNLRVASQTSLSIETLVTLAEKVFNSPTDDRAAVAILLLPSAADWDTALKPCLSVRPNPSLAITDPIAGAVFLVTGANGPIISVTEKSATDADGYSAALRMAIYTTKLINIPRFFNAIDAERKAELCQALLLSVQLANDNLGLAGANNMWSVYAPEVEKEVLEWISEAQAVTRIWLQGSKAWFMRESPSEYSFVQAAAFQGFDAKVQGASPAAFYHARAFSYTVSELIEMHGWHADEDLGSSLRGLQKSEDTLRATASLVAYKVPLSMKKTTTRMCNELVAELTTLNVEERPEQALSQLVLLNAIIQNQEDAPATIAKQRLIFFIRHVMLWCDGSSQAIRSFIEAEVFRAFAVLLPMIEDIYGDHWAQILAALVEVWNDTGRMQGSEYPTSFESRLPLVYTSLKLYAKLRSVKDSENANDDLKDAWSANLVQQAKGLIRVLEWSAGLADGDHQPLSIVNELLARQISNLSLPEGESPGEVYSLLSARSQAVQKTAFELLRKRIATAQEQVSIDTALSDQSARLPEELLSLILEAPTSASIEAADFERTMPLQLRSYLLSWLLVFDHFQHSSFKVKTDYATHLKDGNYVGDLLEFTSDFLGHGKGRPVDVSRFNIASYRLGAEESPERETQWILAHNYFLCLKYLPSLAKSWWIDCRSRQKVLAVETWTEKFISPLIISDALAGVSEWASSQDTSSDEALTVKVAPRAREVSASYEVDEQTMAIVIRLPGSYPLGQAVVEGVNRVAVDEKKWRTWLINTQGVITFSNGNLVDGLVAFRRNVTGALKGQTECAICYSIVSQDKQLPNKRCGTCKNLFHSSCLFRWFKTSNSSSCPLCRNAFNYG